jgi:hypothetical protein
MDSEYIVKAKPLLRPLTQQWLVKADIEDFILGAVVTVIF